MDKRKEFTRIADELASGQGLFAAHLAEPWPQWFKNVVARFTRVFAPDFTLKDFVERPEHVYGHVAAFELILAKAAQEINLDEIPDRKEFRPIKRALERFRTDEFAQISKTVAAAHELPAKQMTTFFTAYGDGLRTDTAGYGINRLEDSKTVQICFFLMCMRPWIEAKKVSTVTELFKWYMKFQELDETAKDFFKKNPASLVSLRAQFRKICSEDKVKLRGRGRPRKK
jgi:hypothetical protein